jgi:glycosyltransferase involved in cell wall biosynthesis
MRLNWFSPLLPERTDIAHYTSRLAPALARQFDVTFWADRAFSRETLPLEARSESFDSRNVGERDSNRRMFQGLNVYNFGNDAQFHRGIFQVARSIPGLAVLHDTRLHHFVFELYRNASPPWSPYIELAERLYGNRGADRAREIVAEGGRSIDEFVEEMPFLEAVANDAIAVICHSKAAREEIQQRSDTPVLTLPLPYSSLNEGSTAQRRWVPPWRLVIYGYLNPNRRLESILQALGALRGQVDFKLDVFGTVWDPARVEAAVVRAGLSSRVDIHGFVPEPMLDEAIASAHLSFNLRHPTMGEASGAILRSWAHATPALVTNAGWYSDLPDAVALKLSIENEFAEIQQGLMRLDRQPRQFEAMGLAAQRRLEEVHSPEVYAAHLAEAASDVPRLMTRRAARHMLEQVAIGSRSSAERRMLLDRAESPILELFSLH